MIVNPNYSVFVRLCATPSTVLVCNNAFSERNVEEQGWLKFKCYKDRWLFASLINVLIIALMLSHSVFATGRV